MSKKNKKKKRYLNGQFVWLLVVIASIIFFTVFATRSMFPDKWKWTLADVLVFVLLFTGVLSSAAPKNRLVKLLDFILIFALTGSSVLLPYYQSKVSSLFDGITGNTAGISLYIMSKEYQQAHPEIFDASNVSEELGDYAGTTFITGLSSDGPNQQFALREVEKVIGSNYDLKDCASAIAEAEALYEGMGDIMVVSDSMVSMITDTPGFESFESQTTKIAHYTRTITTEVAVSDVSLTTKPFCVFIGGNDQEGALQIEGRTDVCLLMAVNPLTAQVAIITLPRDSYIPNPDLGEASDKLTHLGLQGIDNTLNGLSDYLDEKIDNYVLVNFATFRSILDSIGGVDIDNPYEFIASLDHYYHYPEGNIHISGDEALWYCRERYSLPNGDFDRNAHQAIVLKAVFEKVTSSEMIIHFNSLLDNLQGKFLTNLSSESIYAFCKKQLEEGTKWNIQTYHVTGDTGMEICASATDTYLSVVYPYPNQVEYVRSILDTVFAGGTLPEPQEPEGSYEDLSESGDSQSYNDFSYQYSTMGDGQ